jgi:hypothetical protein
VSLSGEDRIKVLEELVSELIKEEYQDKLVQTAMSELGLDYSDNQVECINQVLSELHAKGSSPTAEL